VHAFGYAERIDHVLGDRRTVSLDRQKGRRDAVSPSWQVVNCAIPLLGLFTDRAELFPAAPSGVMFRLEFYLRYYQPIFEN
jgi:hypothetical protein